MNQNWTGKIAFASGKAGDYDIWTFDLAEGQLSQLTFGTFWNDKPKWSPDGQWIVYVSNCTGFQEIYKTPAAGGEPVQLTQLNGWADAPAFSPDGSSIAYISNEAGNNDIWLMDAEGRNRIQVTRHNSADDHVEWTVDNRGLLWSSDREGGDADIWHYEISTQQETQLNADRGADMAPAVSPDGSLIAFCSNRQKVTNPEQAFQDRDKDIWLMTIDGQLPVRLTENQGADFAPCWSPDGKSLLYTSSQGRQDCHLRVMDLSHVLAAYASGNPQLIEEAADDICSAPVELDRQALQAEIGARRSTNPLTSWMPDKWVNGCYPPGYFGLERNPHWVGAAAAADCSGAATPTHAAAL